jgi:hypothetical protein
MKTAAFVLGVSMALHFACMHPPHVVSNSHPRLVRSEGSWFVTGLSDDAAMGIEQGRLFAVMLPIVGTEDQRPIAVMRAVGTATGTTVQVALQCLAPGMQLVSEMKVTSLRSSTDTKVGPCLARVVDVGLSTRGEDFVVLDVGSGAGVQLGDQYVLLGVAITAEGHVPLGLDATADGVCQISADPMHLKPNTARCMIVEPPRSDRALDNSFAAWMPREGGSP